MENKKYYWSFEHYNEYYTGAENTVEKCIEEAREVNKKEYDSTNKYVFIGELEKYEPCIDAEWVIETLIDSAYDECGEPSEQWLNNVTKEHKEKLKEKLNKTLKEWLKETENEPDYFGKIINVKKYDLETGEIVEF